MTVAVVALDAADHRLVTGWDCEWMQLDNCASLETFAHTHDQPHTLEVWPTVATGKHPEDHGITPDMKSDTEWDSSLVDTASTVAERVLPSTWRTKLGGHLVDRGVNVEHSRPTTDSTSPFDSVYMWPGLTPATHLGRAWDLLDQSKDDAITSTEFEHELFALAHDEINWVASQSGLVGVHCHVLDAAGHAYCCQEERLRHYYERTNYLLGSLRTCVDDLVIVSDHGMNVAWLGDSDPGTHSWHATVATTLDSELPETVMGFAEWLAGVDTSEESGHTDGFDTNREQLKDLGYL